MLQVFFILAHEKNENKYQSNNQKPNTACYVFAVILKIIRYKMVGRKKSGTRKQKE